MRCSVPSALGRCRWLLVLLVAVTSCDRSVAPAQAQDDEVPSVAVTVWSERHEVFAEYELPVLGEASHFATHVSDNASGAPRRAGPVTYRMTSAGGETHEVVDPAPARDGIYLSAVEFPAAGSWQLSLDVPTDQGVDTIALGEVIVFASAVERGAAPAAADDDDHGISFLKEQQWLLGTKTTLAARLKLHAWVTAPGRVRAEPHRQADVVPPLAGRLVAVTDAGLPRLGTHVEAGELLAWVQPPVSDALVGAITAQADLARLEVGVRRAQAVLERMRLLHASEARSERELEQAEFAHAEAVAARDGAFGALAAYAAAGITSSGDAGGLPRFEVRAPIAGVVDQVLAVAGQFVTAEAPIVRLIDADVVHVQAQMRPEQLARLDVSQPLHVSLAAPGRDIAELGPEAVRLVHVGLQVDERTGRAPVVIAIDNPDQRWRPGQPVDVAVSTARSEQALAIPSAALVEEAGVTVVFVQLGGETFERRVVDTGLIDGDLVEVRAGLAPGERVVSDGAYAVRLASVSTTEAAHGHAH